MSNKPQYFSDLTLKQMFKYHDHTYMMSDDHIAYERVRAQVQIIEDKVQQAGGWSEKMCKLFNKYAPNDEMFQKDFKWISKYEK